jgi:hypothetical protein
MSRFPTDLPKPTSEPWWQTISLADLDHATSVIEQFTLESKRSPAVSREAFARAMALQMLCVDEGIYDQVIDRADAISEGYRPELRPDGDSRKHEAFGKWLDRSEDIGRGLLRCAELLPEAVRAERGDALMEFLRRIEDHIEAHLEFLFHRRAVPFKPRSRESPKAP